MTMEKLNCLDILLTLRPSVDHTMDIHLMLQMSDLLSMINLLSVLVVMTDHCFLWECVGAPEVEPEARGTPLIEITTLSSNASPEEINRLNSQMQELANQLNQKIKEHADSEAQVQALKKEIEHLKHTVNSNQHTPHVGNSSIPHPATTTHSTAGSADNAHIIKMLGELKSTFEVQMSDLKHTVASLHSKAEVPAAAPPKEEPAKPSEHKSDLVKSAPAKSAPTKGSPAKAPAKASPSKVAAKSPAKKAAGTPEKKTKP